MDGNNEVINRVRSFIMAEFPLAQQKRIGDEDSLLDSGVVDSMGVLEIVTFLEQQFDMTLSDEEFLAGDFESIVSLAKLVETKISSEQAA